MSWLSVQAGARNSPVARRLVRLTSPPACTQGTKVSLLFSHFTHPTIAPSNVLVDAVSFSLLNGSTIDFATELIGSSFRVLDNPHAKGSGCGCGVSWELNLDDLPAGRT